MTNNVRLVRWTIRIHTRAGEFGNKGTEKMEEARRWKTGTPTQCSKSGFDERYHILRHLCWEKSPSRRWKCKVTGGSQSKPQWCGKNLFFFFWFLERYVPDQSKLSKLQLSYFTSILIVNNGVQRKSNNLNQLFWPNICPLLPALLSFKPQRRTIAESEGI